jgi:Arc/MetJ-type ribon-helix-helix transcriptional regulator
MPDDSNESPTDSERVTVRLLSKDLKVLESLVRSGKYATLSDVIRAAINNFIETQFAPNHISKITIELPKGNYIELEKIVKGGDSVSVEDAIRNAVREYIQNRVNKLLKEYEEKKKSK